MGVELPHGGETFIPEVPENLKNTDSALYEYLQSLKLELERISQGHFDNSFVTTTAVNSGTSGTFAISSGGSIVVTSGIVINVTS